MDILNYIDKMQQMYGDKEPSSMVQEPRNSFSGGGLAKALMLLKNLNRTGPIRNLEQKLIKKNKSEGMDLLEAIKKAQAESTTIKNNAKNKILDDAIKETDITSDDYVELIDQKIKIIEPEYYADIKRWSNDRPDLADKTRALFYPDWAEAKYGENYVGVLQDRQAKTLKTQSDEIDKMYPDSDGGIQDIQQQTVTEIDDMNTANLDELLEGRKKNAEGGFQQLVQPSGDGSRPGYQGKRIGLKEKTTVAEGNKLAKQYNKIITTAFDKGDMSRIPSWKSFLENKTLKHASSGFYRSRAANFSVINASAKKFELADRLIDEASKTLKHTEWMDIQKKLSPGAVIDTRQWRNYIDRLDTKPDKANKAFNYLLNNDIQLKLPKNLSKTMAVEGSLLRKVISDITGLKSSKAIRAGLNMNESYNKYIDQIKFANQGNLWTEGEGRTLSQILDNADYRMKGNISWTSDINNPKLANRANKNVFDYALRNFNYHQLNKTGEGQIQFFDKKTNKPVDWNTLPKNKDGFRTIKPNSVYFIDSTQKGQKTKWDLTKIDADNMKWSKGTGSSGMFDEVFQAKDTYDNLLSTEVTDPRNPKGKKVSFKKLMKDVYQIGFNNFGNPYAVEHTKGVANSPFKNLSIASQRTNSALSALNRNKTISKKEKNLIFKELQKEVFNPADKNVIDNIIKSTEPLQSDVLVKGQTITESEIKLNQKKLVKFFKDSGIPCIKGVGGNCTSINDYQKGYNKLVEEGAQGSKQAIQKLGKFTKTMRGITGVAKYTGYGLLAEAGFMIPFAVGDYAAGKKWSRIIGNATNYGFGPIFGQSELEEFKAALPKGSAAVQAENVLSIGDEIDRMEKQKVNPGYGRIGFQERAPIQRQKVYDAKLDKYFLNMQPFIRPSPHIDVGQFYDQNLFDKAMQEGDAAREKIMQEDLIRQQQRDLTNPMDFMAAGGGLAGLSGGDKSGPPPESGPASQGLRSLIKNGRKL